MRARSEREREIGIFAASGEDNFYICRDLLPCRTTWAAYFICHIRLRVVICCRVATHIYIQVAARERAACLFDSLAPAGRWSAAASAPDRSLNLALNRSVSKQRCKLYTARRAAPIYTAFSRLLYI